MPKQMPGALVVALTLFAACSDTPQEAAELPSWTFSPEMLVTFGGALSRPEDGAALAGGRLVIADQIHGLRLIEADGSSRPFGRFAAAGYEHKPPEIVGGPNGVSLEPGGTHLLVSDVFRGGIYRVAVESEDTDLVYQHSYGVNTARRDRSGGIWFTQSTRNNPEDGEAELFRSVDIPVEDGGLFYIAPFTRGDAPEAVQVVGGFRFANGIALDEDAGHVYVAETMASRLHRFSIGAAPERASDATVVLEVDHPDNLEFDEQGRLWIASPVRSEIVVFDPDEGRAESVFRIATPASEKQIQEIDARLSAGEPWLDLMTPTLWEPGPGLITGMILSPDSGPVYLTGLGAGLVQLSR